MITKPIKMITLLMGKKIGMSQVISDSGDAIPVTYVEIGDNEIVQIKTEQRDGYNAVVLGAHEYNRPSKNRKFKNVCECKLDSVEGINLGDKFDVGVFSGDSKLTVTGFSKGKGFTGEVKKWNRSITRKTHGTKDTRHGTTMNCAITGRSKKGIHMAGRSGTDRVTLRNRIIPLVDAENRVIAIKGPIPGAINGLVIIKREKQV